jgi:tetrahydrodipicolinate N-succinyltransferase
MKAEEAIKKAQDDISAAEKDLAQVDTREYWRIHQWLSICIWLPFTPNLSQAFELLCCLIRDWSVRMRRKYL